MTISYADTPAALTQPARPGSVIMLTGTNRAGVRIPTGASHVTVMGSTMARVGEGVAIGGSFVTVTHRTIHDPGMGAR